MHVFVLYKSGLTIFCHLHRLWGEPVNLREQHDALEFFNSLVDSLDEALKALGQPPVLSKVMGGSFADQKICKDCPHRSVILPGMIWEMWITWNLIEYILAGVSKLSAWWWLSDHWQIPKRGAVHNTQCRHPQSPEPPGVSGAVRKGRLVGGCQCLPLWKVQQKGTCTLYICRV